LLGASISVIHHIGYGNSYKMQNFNSQGLRKISTEARSFFLGEEKDTDKKHGDLGKAFQGLISLALGNILFEETHSVLQSTLKTRLGGNKLRWPGGGTLIFFREDPATMPAHFALCFRDGAP
jgi:hypothetical protein